MTDTAARSAGPRKQAQPRGHKPRGKRSRKTARERILDAAADLFYRRGIHQVGVDLIIEEADVAKATFYNHFPSKDDLVLAWLREPDVRWLISVREEVERRADTPRARLLAFFDVLEELFRKRGFRGCPYLNTVAEIPDARHPARKEVLGFHLELESYLRELLGAAGLPDADDLASQLILVVMGAWAAAVIRGSSNPATFGRATVERLIGHASQAGRG
jgi:AcrR family transcriptional regulator